MIITIDGPIATGKSTIAKTLAREIGYIYFDTGAMYRCLTYGVLKKDIHIDDREQLNDFLHAFKFDIKSRHGKKHYYVGNEDVTDAIRLDKVTSHVSSISAIPMVRDKLVAMQRELAIGVNAVFEGRDMGTIVFPKAEIKIYLTGRPEVRAKRRYDELKRKYPEETKDLTIEKSLEDLNRRDHLDLTREISPLKQAPEALVIDTSDLSIQEIIFKILEFKDLNIQV
ncbi:(d)CMP kinase [Neochlamydia sp. AcF84]|uniref:(d)CMP kinase n=1 Tax=Neochlamydia sp. AcF84 TaxID=2315858 RepID=UPI00140BDA9D|nr:(d)CMP kinase [Neochlamydia sp. AcF84]